jgi:hypothetical protein
VTNYPIRAAEFRERAAAESLAGAAARLEQVRAKHERAAQVWSDLAEGEDLREAQRTARQAGLELSAARKAAG